MVDGGLTTHGLFEEGRNCWQAARADRLSVIVDAADYFAVLRKAMLQAQNRIMLVGWDFDGRISFQADERLDGEPNAVGDFLLWLVERKPDLEVYLLRWDTGALKALFRGSTALTAFKWAIHPRIHMKLDGHHPVASSHHQKIVSIDDCLAFCGGIDMTGDRWDTREHLRDDPRRIQPHGGRYKPWHDATTAFSGPIAAIAAQECRQRWHRATGIELAGVEGAAPCWPEGLDPLCEDVQVALARSHPEMKDQEPVYEIEQLFIDQIEAAKRTIYLESQYFASRAVAEAIGRRLEETDGPEVVIINPETAEGWLQPIAMDSARARLVAALKRADRHGRLAIYHPFTSGGDSIYVHAKISIIDDRMLRIGSANLNNRSMRLDTECDVCLDAETDTGSALSMAVASVRNDLLAEHLDVSASQIAHMYIESGSLIRTIEALRGDGKSLRRYEIPELDKVEAWLADHELLDPEGPEEMFEPLTKHGLFRWLSPPPDA